MSLSRRGLLQLGALGAAAATLPARAQGAWTNVMLVVLSGMGWPQDRLAPQLPHRAALAAESTTYTRLYTADPSPAPALASLLTGRASAEHGVVLDGLPLPPDAPTLLGHAAAGGRQVAWAGSWAVPGRRAADEATVLVGPGSDRRTVSAVRAFLSEQTTTRPWMLGVRLDPAAALRRHRRRIGPRAGLELGLAPAELPLPPKMPAPPDATPPGFLAARGVGPRPPETLRTDGWCLARAHEQADALLGAIVDALHHSAHDSRTLLVVVGDHGDAAGTWGVLGGAAPLASVLRVPLYLRWGTDRTARRCERALSATHLAGTLCRVMDLPVLPGASEYDLRTPVADEGAPSPDAVSCDILVDGDVVISEEGMLFSWRKGDGLDQLVRPDGGAWQDPAGSPVALALRQHRASRMAALRPAALHRGGLDRALAARSQVGE